MAFGVTGSAADFGSGPGGVSTAADLGLDGGSGGVSGETASAATAGFDRSAFSAQRAMDAFNAVPGARDYVSVWDPSFAGFETHPTISRRNPAAQAVGSFMGGTGGALLGGAIGRSRGVPGVGSAYGGVAGAIFGFLAGDEVGGQQRESNVPPDAISGSMPASFGTFSPNSRGFGFAQGGHGDNDLRGSAGSDILGVRAASYTNAPAGLTFSTDRGERYILSPTGQAQPLAEVLENLARTIRTGGTPGPNQRIVIDAMTPAQRRAAGVFLAPDGTVRAFREVLTAAVQNAAAGRPLTTNQQAALQPAGDRAARQVDSDRAAV